MIYFDNAATTKPSATALNKAAEFNSENFYNPSALYRGGLNCLKAIKEAKEFILKSLGVSASEYEVIFTSCGSESDNTAIFGAVKRGVFVTSAGEHSAVYKSFAELKQRGNTAVFIDLKKDGTVDEEKLYDFVNKNGADFVSLVHVNNETGGINDVNAISEKLKKLNPKLVFHSDGVQAYGKIPVKLNNGIDLYSLSVHKINALKGTGALIKKKKLNLSPLLFGGGQENGLRSGTENVFGIKVFEYAAREKFAELSNNLKKISEIKEYIAVHLDKDLFSVISGANSSPYILSVSAKGLRGEVLMHTLEDENIIVGNGSACSSKNRYSRVLEACGYGKDILDGVVRISFSALSTMEEAEKFVRIFNEKTLNLKRMMK